MAREKLVEAILEYQTEKRALVKRVTGMELIPDEVALTAEQLDENSIDGLTRKFEPSPFLSETNCLHCAHPFDKQVIHLFDKAIAFASHMTNSTGGCFKHMVKKERKSLLFLLFLCYFT